MKKAPAKKKPAPKKPAPRDDFGAPIDAFFDKQPPAMRAIAEALRTMVEAAAPDATSALKWGMPSYTIGDTIMCVIAGHKSHVNLILSGPPGTYADPKGLLEGEGKTGKHLKLTKLEDLPRADVKKWLTTAAARARKTK